jgi:CHAT domain-containing protein
LTACDSGEVLVQAGNEVMGFRRALFAAGAKRLILTNWLVDDRVSTEYATAFYRALAEHLSVEAAHRRAIDRLRQRFSHPYFWAGYMLSSRS